MRTHPVHSTKPSFFFRRTTMDDRAANNFTTQRWSATIHCTTTYDATPTSASVNLSNRVHFPREAVDIIASSATICTACLNRKKKATSRGSLTNASECRTSSMPRASRREPWVPISVYVPEAHPDAENISANKGHRESPTHTHMHKRGKRSGGRDQSNENVHIVRFG